MTISATLFAHHFSTFAEIFFLEQDHPVILFDGVCNYCNAVINAIIARDRKSLFRFAALQSPAGQKILAQWNLPQDNFDSFILIDQGRLYKKSSAALRIANKLAWYWKWVQAFWIFPRFIRDFFYGIIARNRYKWFGKKDECMVPTPAIRQRFLDD